MYEEFNIWTFLAGLPLGLAVAGIVLFVSWRRGKKERRFDERYTRIHQHARSISWGVTTAAVLIAWTIITLVEGPSLAFFVLSSVWVTHMLSYVIGAAIASRKN